MKRRLLANDADLDAAPRRKRVRYNSLERTLAHMSLDSPLALPSEDVDMWPRITPCPHDPLPSHVVLPGSVEEPTASYGSVEMEVEPTGESSRVPPLPDGPGQLDIKEVEISPAVLQCIRRQTQRFIPLPSPSSDTRALVLYRPAQPPAPEQPCPIQVAQEDDIMEVE